ncbi:MAG: hypothetical protein EOP24_30965 [Hyphomicrobiales bacterium]|nr:MAG: hypothetical protein EOP24_30965 [Hyphomicrobiales bacterium]
MDAQTTELNAEIWIAACAHQLQQRWRSVHPSELEAVASELWHDEHLRAMAPAQAATEWLEPVACKLCAPGTSAPPTAR